MLELLPDSEFRFEMKLVRGDARNFFSPSDDASKVLAERVRWLSDSPERYSALLPEGWPLLEEFVEEAKANGVLTEQTLNEVASSKSPLERLRVIGARLEPDFMLLARQPDNQFRLVGGCVCFPSSWSLEEKVGHPVDFIHAVVPGLNARIGRQIEGFLARLKPGAAWCRTNWGLSRHPDLNQHPARGLLRLDDTVEANEVFFRIEHQALIALPRTGGILFGIRIESRSLFEIIGIPDAAGRLARQLRSMPIEVAAYKGLASARERIVKLLERNDK